MKEIDMAAVASAKEELVAATGVVQHIQHLTGRRTIALVYGYMRCDVEVFDTVDECSCRIEAAIRSQAAKRGTLTPLPSEDYFFDGPAVFPAVVKPCAVVKANLVRGRFASLWKTAGIRASAGVLEFLGKRYQELKRHDVFWKVDHAVLSWLASGNAAQAIERKVRKLFEEQNLPDAKGETELCVLELHINKI